MDSSNDLQPHLYGDTLALANEAGLSANSLYLHRKRILSGDQPQFPLTDACRLDNQGILALPQLPEEEHAFNPKQKQADARTACFVPAAGAASRFKKPFVALQSALEAFIASAKKNQNPRSLLCAEGSRTDTLQPPLTAEHGSASARQAILDALNALNDKNAQAWSLPEGLRKALASPERVYAACTISLARVLLSELNQPKALYPATLDGITFLQMKWLEQQLIGSFGMQVFVCPKDMSEHFREHLKSITLEEDLRKRASLQRDTDWLFLEQDDQLCTLRFQPDGQPVRNPKTQDTSKVPGGHGMLTKLFERVHTTKPKIDRLFIRNIDNVNGASPATVKATRRFLHAYEESFATMQSIRQALKNDDPSSAAHHAARLLRLWGLKLQPEGQGQDQLTSDPIGFLWHVQKEFFHTSDAALQAAQRASQGLLELFSRPFSLLGQVPNKGNDVGGSPVFANTPFGRTKLCVELPHVSDQDRADVLQRPEVTTHFNPVFAMIELQHRADLYESDHPFWLIAQKLHGDQPTCYHEDLLYEIIGNSHFQNLLFVEVPRTLFHPHKTMDDACGLACRDWFLQPTRPKGQEGHYASGTNAVKPAVKPFGSRSLQSQDRSPSPSQTRSQPAVEPKQISPGFLQNLAKGKQHVPES